MQIAYALKNNVTYIGGVENETKQKDSTVCYSNDHEWCNEGINPEVEAIQDVPLDVFPWWMEQLDRNKLVSIEDVSKLPEEAEVEKEQLTQQGVKSAIVIPIEENEQMLGFMGLDSVGSFNACLHTGRNGPQPVQQQ